MPLSELQKSQPLFMEASMLSRALEGKSIPGINLFHDLRSRRNSHFSDLLFAISLLAIKRFL